MWIDSSAIAPREKGVSSANDLMTNSSAHFVRPHTPWIAVVFFFLVTNSWDYCVHLQTALLGLCNAFHLFPPLSCGSTHLTVQVWTFQANTCMFVIKWDFCRIISSYKAGAAVVFLHCISKESALGENIVLGAVNSHFVGFILPDCLFVLVISFTVLCHDKYPYSCQIPSSISSLTQFKQNKG